MDLKFVLFCLIFIVLIIVSLVGFSNCLFQSSYDLSVYDARNFFKFNSKPYLIFEKCDPSFCRYFWRDRRQYYYTMYCNELLTIERIFNHFDTMLTKSEQTLSKFLEDFVVELFTSCESKFEIHRKQFFEKDNLKIWTQSALERKRNSGKPVFGNLTPNVLVKLRSSEKLKHQRKFYTIVIDAEDTENKVQAIKEKRQKFEGHCDLLLLVLGNKMGEIEFIGQVPDQIRRLFSDEFNLKFGKEIVKNKVSLNKIFCLEYKNLKQEIQYWQNCQEVGAIVKSKL